MAICPVCDQEMNTVASCIERRVGPRWESYAPLVYMNEDAGDRCHDCGVLPGGFHHDGCDMERCPKCDGQLITCACWDSITSDDIDDDDE